VEFRSDVAGYIGGAHNQMFLVHTAHKAQQVNQIYCRRHKRNSFVYRDAHLIFLLLTPVCTYSSFFNFLWQYLSFLDLTHSFFLASLFRLWIFLYSLCFLLVYILHLLLHYSLPYFFLYSYSFLVRTYLSYVSHPMLRSEISLSNANSLKWSAFNSFEKLFASDIHGDHSNTFTSRNLCFVSKSLKLPKDQYKAHRSLCYRNR